MSAFVYILRCADGSYYIGSARGETLDKRMGEHHAGTQGGYTSTRLPVELVWAEQFQQITDAIATERRIKGWSRAKKEALIRGDWAEVQRLAKRRGVGSLEPRPETPHQNLQPPHPEVPGTAGPRWTHHDRACFEAELRSAPQHEEAGSRK